MTKRTEIFGHKLKLLHYRDKMYENANHSVWYCCSVCELEIYYMPIKDMIIYNSDVHWKIWDLNNCSGIIDLNLTCDEVLIKKILE